MTKYFYSACFWRKKKSLCVELRAGRFVRWSSWSAKQNFLEVLSGARDAAASDEAVAGELLAGETDGLGGLAGFLNFIRGLRDDHLDVARLAHVGTHTTVGTVSATTALRSAVDGDHLDGQVVGVEALGFGVGLGVLEHVKDNLDRLDRPATLASRDVELLGLRLATTATVVAKERDDLLLLEDILEIDLGLLDVPALDGLADIVGVLVTSAQVRAHSLGRLGRDLGLSDVTSLDHGEI